MRATARTVIGPELREAAAGLLADGWAPALVAGHDRGDHVILVQTYLRPGDDARELHLDVPRGGGYPSCAELAFPLGRFEREVRDMFGIVPQDHPIPRRLVRHTGWPQGWHPMLDASVPGEFTDAPMDFPFIPVEGDGVYEIPVGPVHAGLIEPGHFRFFVLGETILRMKTRLWYVHRGIEHLFQGRTPAEGVALAERISGDTAVGHGVAYCLAVESALGIEVPREVAATRALLLELERIGAHVTDLGALANDVGFGFPNAHAGRLKEKLLRHAQHVTGHRLLRGGTGIGWAALRNPVDVALVQDVAAGADELARLVLDHGVASERFRGTAVLPRATAETLGCLGYVGRASGLPGDARGDHPTHPGLDLADAGFVPCVEETGDVLARFRVRHRELTVSARMVAALAEEAVVGEPALVEPAVGEPRAGSTLGAPAGTTEPAPPAPMTGAVSGLGVVEAARGRLVHRVELGGDGRVVRLRAVDPGFFNWPGLPLALADTIVPDFPLANKSFNQSYAGNDL